MGERSEKVEWVLVGFPKTDDFNVDEELEELVKVEEIRVGSVSRKGVYVKVDNSRLCKLLAFSLEGFNRGIGGARIYLYERKDTRGRQRIFFLVDMNEGRARRVEIGELKDLVKRHEFRWIDPDTRSLIKSD